VSLIPIACARPCGTGVARCAYVYDRETLRRTAADGPGRPAAGIVLLYAVKANGIPTCWPRSPRGRRLRGRLRR
jgi:diaminopimelate decarboxylase